MTKTRIDTDTAANVLAENGYQPAMPIVKANHGLNGKILPGNTLGGTSPGRPSGQTVTAIARQYTDKAMLLLSKIMDDPRAPQSARVTAAQALLDRGWGKAPIQIDLNVRMKFDDFLRDVGVLAQAQRDKPDVIDVQDVSTAIKSVASAPVAQSIQDAVMDAIQDEIDDSGRIDDENCDLA